MAAQKPAMALLCAVAAMTFALYVVLHSSGMPNKVYEPFRERGGVSRLMLFSIAAIVHGFGSRAIGWRPGKVSRPWLELPFLVSALAVLRPGLLIRSVTEGRLAHITGSNHPYMLVTDRDVWGASWKHLFLALDSPEPISFFERPVRHADMLAGQSWPGTETIGSN